MSAPDVAALLARVEHITRDCYTEPGAPCVRVSDMNGYVCANCGRALDGPQASRDQALELLPALATALRAALADQRRIDWLEANSRYFSGAIEMDHDSRLNGDALSLRAAIDAALTADGGV